MGAAPKPKGDEECKPGDLDYKNRCWSDNFELPDCGRNVGGEQCKRIIDQESGCSVHWLGGEVVIWSGNVFVG